MQLVRTSQSEGRDCQDLITADRYNIFTKESDALCPIPCLHMPVKSCIAQESISYDM